MPSEKDRERAREILRHLDEQFILMRPGARDAPYDWMPSTEYVATALAQARAEERAEIVKRLKDDIDHFKEHAQKFPFEAGVIREAEATIAFIEQRNTPPEEEE